MGSESPQGDNKPINTYNEGGNKSSFSEFSDHPSFNAPIAIAWVVALIAVLATVFFWIQDKNMNDALQDKNSEKVKIEQEVGSASYAAIAKEITDFKASVTGLVAAKKDRISFVDFLDEFSQKVTKTSVINSLGYDSTGKISLNGKAPSYRAVAELVIALKAWDKLKDVDLTTVSMTEPSSDNNNKIEAIFSISAKVVQKTSANSLTTGSGAVAPAGGN